MRRSVVVASVVLLTAAMLSGPAAAAGTTSVDCATGSLQVAIDDPAAYDTINVTGVCFENIVVGRSLTIAGSGSGSAVIDGIITGPALKITAGTVTVNDVTIRRGVGVGAGINNAGRLTLNDSVVTDNEAGGGWGGGLYVHPGASATINDSLFTGNNASFCCGGGGIFNDGMVTLNRTTLDGNSTLDSGGGIFNDGGVVVVNDSVITNNEAEAVGGAGGGIFNDGGDVTLNRTLVAGNTATNTDGHGAGAYQTVAPGGELTLRDTTFDGNIAGGNGGAVHSGADVIALRSTFSNNTARNGGALFFVGTGSGTLTNSTLSGNDADTMGTGGGSGGAIYAVSGSVVDLRHVTVTDNDAEGAGGIFASAGSTVRIGRSILAGNRAGVGVDCAGNIATSFGYNLLGADDAACTFPAAGSDLTGTAATPLDPVLAALTANGGHTETHALGATSPAFNLIPVAACTLVQDQRGVPRPSGPGCDTGSFEVAGPFCAGLPVTIKGTPGDDRILGTAGDDVIHGFAGDDVIFGRGGNDTICGGAGDDELVGGPGGDILLGNVGIDLASYVTAPAGVVVSLPARVATGGAGFDSIAGIEGVKGSHHDDRLIGDARANTLLGLRGDDDLEGRGGDDTLDGGRGDDLLNGRGGDDVLRGGAGIDWVRYVNAAAGVIVDIGAGTASGGDGVDVLDRVENAAGSSFDDVLRGNGAANTLLGRRGDDSLRGRAGDDELRGNDGRDAANGGSGTDLCRAEAEVNCEL